MVAPGLIERPYVFEGNDLPGVMLATAVRRLVNLYAVRPGSRAVVFTANEEGLAAPRTSTPSASRSSGWWTLAGGRASAGRRAGGIFPQWNSTTARTLPATCSSPRSGGRRRRPY